MKFFYRFKQIILASGDLVCFCIGFWLSLLIRNLKIPNLEKITEHISLFFFLFLLWIIINYINGLYDLRSTSKKTQYKKIIETGIISLIISVVFFYLLPNARITPKTILLLTVFFGYGINFLWRALYHQLIGTKILHSHILFLGYTKEIQELIDIVSRQPGIGYKVIAIVNSRQDENPKNISDSEIEYYQDLSKIRGIVNDKRINLVVTAPYMNENQEVASELYELLFWPVQITDLASFYETITGRIPPYTFSETWFLKNLRTNPHPVYYKFRRLIDFVAAIIMSILLLILFPLIALFIRLNSKGPILFKQERVGLGGQTFTIYKFRTMHALASDGSAETDGAQFATKNDKRITTIGKFLRKTRLDEIPQALNLLKGDITLIGPRPERPEIVSQLQDRMPYYPLRHTIKPGITGWAAVHQHYTDNLETSLQKLQYDLYYIKNRSLLLDLFIVLKTINVVLRGMGQ